MSGVLGGAGSKSGVIGTTELDYEEGEWSPQLSDGSNNATMNSGSTGGSYIKIGKTINLFGRCTTSSLGSVSGSVRITGLPYTIGTGQKHYSGMGIGEAGNLACSAGENPALVTQLGGTYLHVMQFDSGVGSTNLQAGVWSSDGYLIFSGIYKID